MGLTSLTSDCTLNFVWVSDYLEGNPMYDTNIFTRSSKMSVVSDSFRLPQELFTNAMMSF